MDMVQLIKEVLAEEKMREGIESKYLGKMVRVRDNSNRKLPSGDRYAYVEHVFPRKKMLIIILALGEKIKVREVAVREILSNHKPDWWGDSKKAVKMIRFRKKRRRKNE